MRFARYPAALREKAQPKAIPDTTRKANRGVILCAACVLAAAAGCRRLQAPVASSTATVSGRVLGSDGRPLGGAIVALTADPDEGRVPVATARTTSAGTFRLERVPTAGYRIRARATGHVEALARIEVALPNGRYIELKLPPTVVLGGLIQDGRGTPIPLARVLAFPVADPTSQALHETRANDRGAFKLAGLAPGAHRLLIEAPGLGTASAGPVTAPDESLLVVLPGEIRAIVGRVTRAGLAAEGARVLLGGESVPEPRSTNTDREGRFVFAGLGPGAYMLRAEAGGLVAPILNEVVVDRASSQTRKVELVLAPGSFGRGKVVGEDGRPLAGATVQIDLVPATGLWPRVSTATDGTWTSAPLTPGTYRVRARHPGYVARRTLTIEVSPATSSGPAILELVRTGRITGHVVDERGAPLAGATVHDRLAETEELGVIWSRLPLAAEAAALPSGTVLPNTAEGAAGARRATTDATGRFVLDDVPPGRVRVEVLNPSSIPLRTTPVTLAPGALMNVGTLRLQGAIQIAGRVLDVDGQPLGGVRVAATRLASPSDTGVGVGVGLYAVTASDGAFSLPLGAGENRLTASAKGRADVVATFRVPPAGGATESVTLRFSKGGDLSVEGVVHDAERRPLVGARISARSIGDLPVRMDASPPGTRGIESAPLATAITDAGGAFRLTGLPTAAFHLEVAHDGYAPYREMIDRRAPASPRGSVNIEVPMPGGIDGEVHEHVTGAPVPGFHIDARGPDGAFGRFPDGGSRRRASGPLRFSLRRLTPGRWTLRVRAPGYRSLEHVVEVGSAPALGEASVRDLRLELERG